MSKKEELSKVLNFLLYQDFTEGEFGSSENVHYLQLEKETYCIDLNYNNLAEEKFRILCEALITFLENE